MGLEVAKRNSYPLDVIPRMPHVIPVVQKYYVWHLRNYVQGIGITSGHFESRRNLQFLTVSVPPAAKIFPGLRIPDDSCLKLRIPQKSSGLLRNSQ